MELLSHCPVVTTSMLSDVHYPFSKNSPWRPTHCLVNYEYFKKRKTNVKKRFRTVVDSGGLQGATLGKRFDPKEVMMGQNRLGHIAIGLDKIPVTRVEGETLRVSEVKARYITNGSVFEKAAKETAKNMEKMLRHKDEGVKLYVPVQGRTYEEKKSWIEIVEKEHTYDGLAIGGVSLRAALTTIGVVNDFAVGRSVHFLGVGILSTLMPYLYYTERLKKHTEVTADSTAWNKGAMYRLYASPVGSRWWQLGSPVRDHKGKEAQKLIWEYGGMPCSCPFCLKTQNLDFDDPNFGKLLSSHNLITTNNFIEAMGRLVKVPEMYSGVMEEFIKLNENNGVAWAKDTRVDPKVFVGAIESLKEVTGLEMYERCVKNTADVEAYF